MTQQLNGIGRSASSAPAARMSYEEFLEWSHENNHVEWVNGEVVAMPPISDEHQGVGVFLLRIIGDYVEELNLGAMRYEPFQMKTGPNLPGRSPDILFVAKENLARLKKTFLEGPADLAVEIISPDSKGRDRGEKFYEYEEGGVREYWLIDPHRHQAEFYVLATDGVYRSVMPEEGIYRSLALKGFWMKVDWLWQKPSPSITQVLREWKLI
jgi:Uma2 family endonuclease